MPYIYKITNIQNGKMYIGQTTRDVKIRWQEHCRQRLNERDKTKPIYKAINKYGVNNFKIEVVEECSEKDLLEREQYWIEYYGTFKNGYNATVGGKGKRYVDYDLIIETYQQVNSVKITAEKVGVSTKTVQRVLKNYNIPTIPSSEIIRNRYNKIINMFDSDGNYIQTFSSYLDAYNYLHKMIPNTSFETIKSHISMVCKNKRKTAYGFQWSFA